MRIVNLVVIHCSATPNGRRIGGPDQTAAEAIDSWHKQRGFLRAQPIGAAAHLKGIGYHYVIDLDGTVYTGRDEEETGAHVAGFNANSIGICLVGTDKFTKQQQTALAGLCRQISNRRRIPLSNPQRDVVGGKTTVKNGFCGHRDLSPDQDRDGIIKQFEWIKICPGFSVGSWLAGGLQAMPANTVVLGT